MTPGEWREQVGSKIEAERTRQRLSVRAAAKRAGFSEGLWRQIESGARVIAKDQIVTVSPRAATRAAVARALGWSDDSLERLLRGEPPVELGPTTPVAGVGDDELRAQVAALVAGVEAVTARLEQVEAQVREAERRRRRPPRPVAP